MSFDQARALPLLQRTPRVLRTLLEGLPSEWVRHREGPDSWSPLDILGHLVHGELTDWMTRVDLILTRGESQAFAPFDRLARHEAGAGLDLSTLLDRFQQLRERNLEHLQRLGVDQRKLDLRGRHPHLGMVTLRQLLATWVVHDLAHLAQTSRILARHLSDEVGPWNHPDYLRVLQG